MPILSDPSNTRLGSVIREIVLAMIAAGEAVESPRLEELTGSDLMATPLPPTDYPIDKRYHVQEHLDAGAVMLQVKVGADLLSSVGDRLKTSSIKMGSYKCFSEQRGLVPVGYTLCSPDMQAYIGMQSERACSVFGVEARKLTKDSHTPNYQAYNTSLIEWGFRGGFVYPTIPHLGLFTWYMKQVERLVIETARDGTRYHFETLTKVPDQPNPDKQSLQVLKAVPDGCAGLVSKHFPGIGVKRALEYYEFFEGDLIVLLANLCDLDGNWPPGWSETKARNLNIIWRFKPEQLAVKEAV